MLEYSDKNVINLEMLHIPLPFKTEYITSRD